MSGVKFRVKEVNLFTRRVTLRMPFRFGDVTVREAQHIIARVIIENSAGVSATGFASDFLAPKWFDKNPAKSELDNVTDLSTQVAWTAQALVSDTHSASLFDHWLPLQDESIRKAREKKLPALVGAFGSSLLEKAMFDALGRLSGLSFHEVVLRNLVGIQAEIVHHELKGQQPCDWIPNRPLSSVHIRHTVGMLDPLEAEDIRGKELPEDGLPGTLAEYLAQDDVRFLKIKIGGNPEQDLDRLIRVVNAIERARGSDYAVTLDGNEQYRNPDNLVALFESIEACPSLRGLLKNLLFLEQPIPRDQSLDLSVQSTLKTVGRWTSCVLDEADQELTTFREAINVGWRGVSAKTCKGVIKSLFNLALVRSLSTREKPLLVSAEDLSVMPVIGLHQELATIATLGVGHVEKNGHHYARGCDHCTDQEIAGLRLAHGSLYRPLGLGLTLDIHQGRVNL